MFRFNQTIIREPTAFASLKLQYWRQSKCFVIELFGSASAPPNSSITKHFDRRQYCNFSEAQAVGSLMMVWLNRNM